MTERRCRTTLMPLWFPPRGPGDAITLRRLVELIDTTAIQLGTWDVEIVQPAAYPPLLFVWTPPTGPEWTRRRLGALLVEKAGAFIPEVAP